MNLARPLAVLEGAAPTRAREVVPLLGVPQTDAADVAALVQERLIACRTHEGRRWKRRHGRVEPLEDPTLNQAPFAEHGIRSSERPRGLLPDRGRARFELR